MIFRSLDERIDENSIHAIEKSQRKAFLAALDVLSLPKKARALSVSVGDGIWDYLVFKHSQVDSIIATDIVDCAISSKDLETLKSLGSWKFVKVKPEAELPFSTAHFDLVFHQDVLEHVEKPFLFLSEQYRVLKPKGTLLLSTPNLFRPANLILNVLGKLKFPRKIGVNEELGDYIHTQEFYDRQAIMLLQEVGFKLIDVKYSYVGIPGINRALIDEPKSDWGRAMCHYLMFVCRK